MCIGVERERESVSILKIAFLFATPTTKKRAIHQAEVMSQQKERMAHTETKSYARSSRGEGQTAYDQM